MPRPKTLRKIVSPPGFKGYKPYGNRPGKKEHVDLLYEEYEAIKLADYDMMNHQEASKLMGVSRATFARIYESARRKIAQALVEAREIRSVFGNAIMDESWFECNSCHARFTIPMTVHDQQCPMCKNNLINPINSTR
ncbi:MAG: DUF134 domain-containing protein [Bacteroides sp.]|nr:DUF134 domain-containing protein [Bacteroides sp.]